MMETRKEDQITKEKIPYIPKNVNPSYISDEGEYRDSVMPEWLFLNTESLKNKKIDPSIDNQLTNELFFDSEGKSYRLFQGKALGEGAYGEARLAWCIGEDSWAVLKTIKDENKGDELMTLSKKEFDLLQRVDLGLGLETDVESDGVKKHHVLMKLANGVSMRSLLDEQSFKLSAQDRIQIAANLIDQVTELHHKGLIHRDIKPENIIVDPSTLKVTIIDFGVSVTKEAAKTLEEAIGTPLYMPGELFFEGKSGTKSDSYAVGVTLGQLFQFDYDYKRKGRYIEVTFINDGNQNIFNESEKSELFNLVKSLTEKSPDNRLDVSESKHAIHHMNEAIRQNRSQNILILDADTFNQRKEFYLMNFVNMNNYDKVILSKSVNSTISKLDLGKIKYELLKEGVHCHDEYVNYSNKESLAHHLSNLFELNSTDIVSYGIPVEKTAVIEKLHALKNAIDNYDCEKIKSALSSQPDLSAMRDKEGLLFLNAAISLLKRMDMQEGTIDSNQLTSIVQLLSAAALRHIDINNESDVSAAAEIIKKFPQISETLDNKVAAVISDYLRDRSSIDALRKVGDHVVELGAMTNDYPMETSRSMIVKSSILSSSPQYADAKLSDTQKKEHEARHGRQNFTKTPDEPSSKPK